MAKHFRNTFGRYDCPDPGCDMKGRKGLKSAIAVGQHVRHTHKGRTAHTDVPPVSVAAIAPCGPVELALRIVQVPEVARASRQELEQAFQGILAARLPGDF